jgi:hypothetical protein
VVEKQKYVGLRGGKLPSFFQGGAGGGGKAKTVTDATKKARHLRLGSPAERSTTTPAFGHLSLKKGGEFSASVHPTFYCFLNTSYYSV